MMILVKPCVSDHHLNSSRITTDLLEYFSCLDIDIEIAPTIKLSDTSSRHQRIQAAIRPGCSPWRIQAVGIESFLHDSDDTTA
jgi:hypothetical protein